MTDELKEEKSHLLSMLLRMEMTVARYERNNAGHDADYCQQQIEFHKKCAEGYAEQLEAHMPPDEIVAMRQTMREKMPELIGDK